MIKRPVSSCSDNSENSITVKKIIPTESEDEEDSSAQSIEPNFKNCLNKNVESDDDEGETLNELLENQAEESDDCSDINNVVPLKMPLYDSDDSERTSEISVVSKNLDKETSKINLSDTNTDTDSNDGTEVNEVVDKINQRQNYHFEKNSENLDDIINVTMLSEDESSDNDSLLSSLAELLEEQIKAWYKEDGLKRPHKSSKALYDNILTHGIDISDFSLNENQMEKINTENEDIKDLTLDDLIFRINNFDQ